MMLSRKEVEKAYKSRAFVRYDDQGFINYFSNKDFPGLQADPYDFPSSKGHALKGYFYHYEDFDTERLLLFEHGLGGGHRSYMKEIERLCRAGYRVFSYDHTGCMESGGNYLGGFTQFLCDLDDCLRALKFDPSINTSDISIMGHSFGGYSTLNISALHPGIKKIVVISGIVSVKRMIYQTCQGELACYREDIVQRESEANPAYMDYDGVETLKKWDGKTLLIYSDDDPIVTKKFHYDPLYENLRDHENVSFVLTSGKGHNAHYTADACKYLQELNTALENGLPQTDDEKESFKNSFDWNQMTAQDEEIWEKILEFLK